MNTAILNIMIAITSSFLGINLKDIKKILNKKSINNSENTKISASIDAVSKNLVDSKETIENALREKLRSYSTYT